MAGFYLKPQEYAGFLSAGQRAGEAGGNAQIGAAKAFTPGKLLNDFIDRRDKQEQQAIENARQEELMGFKRSAEQRILDKAKQDELLGNTLADLAGSTSKTVTKTIPGRAGNASLVAKQKAANQAIDSSNKAELASQEDASGRYSSLFDKYKTEFIPQKGTVLTAEDGKTPYTTEKVPGTQNERYITESGDKLMFDPKSPLGSLVYQGKYGQGTPKEVELPPKKLYSDQQAHEMALKESGLLGLKGTVAKNDVAKLVPSTPAKTKEITSKMSREEWLNNAGKSLLGNKELTGATKMAAMAKLAGQADVLFGPAKKGLTIRDQIALAKVKSDILDKAKTVADYRSVYPGMPKSITTAAGAKAYAAKQKGRDSGGSYDFKADLYSSLTTKDSGDVEAVDDYLRKNLGAISQMSKADQKAVAARLKAKYNNESSWDISDFLGGSAAGDALD